MFLIISIYYCILQTPIITSSNYKFYNMQFQHNSTSHYNHKIQCKYLLSSLLHCSYYIWIWPFQNSLSIVTTSHHILHQNCIFMQLKTKNVTPVDDNYNFTYPFHCGQPFTDNDSGANETVHEVPFYIHTWYVSCTCFDLYFNLVTIISLPQPPIPIPIAAT
jgi:hypothetical protein